MNERLAKAVLLAFVVGLMLHNAAMAQLWEIGVRGLTLDVAAAWKEALLLVALVAAALGAVRARPRISSPDLFAAGYAAVVVAYALLPQSSLGGQATARGELLALRHHLLPVVAYALGRLVASTWRDTDWLGRVLTLAAGGMVFVGLFDVTVIQLQAWRDSGVPGWYREQLGLEYEGLSGLPENWVYNTGDEQNPLRRLVSTFLSPLASAYALVVALIFVAARPSRWWAILAALLYVGLLYTHTRAAFAALAFGLLVLAAAQRRVAPAIVGVASVVAAAGFVAMYPTLGPSTSYTSEELAFLRENAREGLGESADPFSPAESSTSSHLRNLRDGVRTVLEHPQGYGLGNAGVVAKRTEVEIKAGESTYTELGVDAGLAGMAAFILWSLTLARELFRREPWLAAAFSAVLLLALQTDVIGVHWLAVVVWAAVGIAVTPGPARQPAAKPEPGSAARWPEWSK